MSDQTTVQYAVADGVATITLDRPQVYNALNAAVQRDLQAALRQAERDPAVRCVALTGAGRAFCAGQDLKELPVADVAPQVAQIVRAGYNPLILRLASFPKPTIAALNGVAAGAGLSLALACDLRVAADDARLTAAFVRIGLVPDCGMTYLLPRIVGRARALELCLLGEGIDAPTALAWGLLSRVAPAAELAAATAALAAQLAAGPALALSLIRRGLAYAEGAGLAEVLEWEAQAQQAAAGHADFAEGVAAFRERRPPRFA